MFYDVFEGLCKGKGISPSRACLDMGLSRSLGAKWKSTKANPSFEVLSKVANYFGVSTDYLLGNEQKGKPSGKAGGQEVTYDDFTYALHDETKELTDENKQALLEMARFFKEQQDKKKKQ